MNIVKAATRIMTVLILATLIAGCAQIPKGEDKSIRPDENLPVDNVRLLTGRAALIFKGVVSGVEYETDAETGLPFTYVTFRQIEPIKDLSGEFTSGKRDKLRIRLFGGLKENGTMTVTTHIPSLTLGAVYVVFYTGGDWDLSPIVGGERGVFQVVKSRTLGYEMVFDYYGGVVVGISDLSLKTLPLRGWQNAYPIREVGAQDDTLAVKQTDQVVVDRDSIYTEENVKRMLARQAEGKSELQKEDATIVGTDSIKSQMLKDLSSRPMSLEAFIKGIVEIDNRYAGEFHRFYSQVQLEGKSVKRERRPLGLRQNKETVQ